MTNGCDGGLDGRIREQWYARLEKSDDQTLKGRPPGGTPPPVTPADHLEKRVDRLETRQNIFYTVLVVATVALFVAIAAAASSTNGRVDQVGLQLSSINRETGVVSSKVDDVMRRLDLVDRKLDAILERLPAKK